MKKSILIAIAIAFVLCIYGYFASTAGHDHSDHGQVAEQGHSDHSH
jgi:hypothetical protein